MWTDNDWGQKMNSWHSYRHSFAQWPGRAWPAQYVPKVPGRYELVFYLDRLSAKGRNDPFEPPPHMVLERAQILVLESKEAVEAAKAELAALKPNPYAAATEGKEEEVGQDNGNVASEDGKQGDDYLDVVEPVFRLWNHSFPLDDPKSENKKFSKETYWRDGRCGEQIERVLKGVLSTALTLLTVSARWVFVDNEPRPNQPRHTHHRPHACIHTHLSQL